jgi:hypothetical protein
MNTLYSLKQYTDEVKKSAKLVIDKLNHELSTGQFLLECGHISYDMYHNKYNNNCDKRTLINEKRDDDITIALNNAFYALALLFSKKQTIEKFIIMDWKICQLCGIYGDETGICLKVYDGDAFNIHSRINMCGRCNKKTNNIKTAIICSAKILLIPHIIELPELQNLICETFLSIV